MNNNMPDTPKFFLPLAVIMDKQFRLVSNLRTTIIRHEPSLNILVVDLIDNHYDDCVPLLKSLLKIVRKRHYLKK